MLPQFGTDGVRGVANTELTPEVALALGRAIAGVFPVSAANPVASARLATDDNTTALSASHDNTAARLATDDNGPSVTADVVIGRDTRRSGAMLEGALIAGLTSAGLNVITLGVVPTPAVAWGAKHINGVGVMISASHNAFPDNGLKVFAPGGLKLNDAQERALEDALHQHLSATEPVIARTAAQPPTGDRVGTIIPEDTLAQLWADDLVASAVPGSLVGLKLVLDCAHGAAWRWAPEIFRRAGAHLHVMGDDPNGLNINDGVGSTEPEAMAAKVVELGFDAGLAFDGDADRVIAADHTGTIIDGDRMLALLARSWHRRGKLAGDTMVVTVMSNLGLHLAMQRQGIAVEQTAVGDRHVLAALDAGGHALGGEQSGHIICRDLATTGDGILAGIQLLDAVVRSRRSLHEEAADAMTVVPQVLRNVRVGSADPAAVLQALSPQIAKAETELGSDGRVLVRASGTEPLIRVMVEHLEGATAQRVCDHLVDMVEQHSRV